MAILRFLHRATSFSNRAALPQTWTRIIAATNRDLLLEVKEKNFRQDLYYRLKTVNINVPSLIEHMDDIFDLVERFGFEFTVKNDIPYKGFDSAAIDIMKSYEWPGNVRELKNVVESLLVMNKGKRITVDIVKEKLNMETISSNMNLPMPVDMESDQVERELILKQLLYLRQDINDIKQILVNPSASASVSGETTPSNSALFLPSPNSIPSTHNNKENIEDASMYALNEDTIGEISLDELEHEMIKRCLEKFKGNRRKTAQVLNISERTLYRKIKEYEI